MFLRMESASSRGSGVGDVRRQWVAGFRKNPKGARVALRFAKLHSSLRLDSQGHSPLLVELLEKNFGPYR